MTWRRHRRRAPAPARVDLQPVAVEVARLAPRPGEVVLVRFPPELFPDPESLEDAVGYLNEPLPDDVTVLILVSPEPLDLAVVSAQDVPAGAVGPDDCQPLTERSPT